MPLETDNLATLARKNLALNPQVESETVNAPFSGAYPASGGGVDVSAEVWALVEVKPTGGDCSFELVQRRIGAADFTKVNDGGALAAVDGKGWSELVRVAPLAELAVVIASSSAATSVVVNISPCKG